ncbi:MAG: glycosyltransferase family 4 protein [Rhodothermales bacterium]|nr:glycosyltransferase family 4 protein [Rhodothermales bacterium]
MKALVISPQPVFKPRGTPLSVYYRTLVTSELGWTVDLLTYGEGDDIDIPGMRMIRIPRFRMLGNVKVGPSLLKLFLDGWMFLKMVWLLTFNRYDLIHAHEEAVFFCLFLKPIFRFRYVYDMHSSLPQQLTNFEFTKSRILIRLFEVLEKRSLRSADAVITICQDLHDYAQKILDHGQPHELIENSLLDPVRLVNAPEGSAAESHPALPEDDRIVVYAGTLEPYQGIELLLEAFSAVAATLPDVSLVVAGGNPDQVEHYRRQAGTLRIEDRCLFTGSVSRSAATAINRRASVLVSPRISGGNTPLKVYEQIASGIPLVATNIHSHTQVLNPAVAFLVEPNAESLSAGLTRALTDADEARRKVEAAQQLYARKYARDIYVQKMARLLEPFA